MIGSRSFDKSSAVGARKFSSEGFGGRKYMETRNRAGKDKSDLHRGMEMLMNRSVMKGIVDPVERSTAMGADVSRKMGALSAATGKDPMTMLKTLGSKRG